MKPILPTQKPFEVGDHVMVDTGHAGFVTASKDEKVTVSESADGTGWTMEVEERQLAHVHRPMRHDFSDDEIDALWASMKPARTTADKIRRFARSLLHGKPRE